MGDVVMLPPRPLDAEGEEMVAKLEASIEMVRAERDRKRIESANAEVVAALKDYAKHRWSDDKHRNVELCVRLMRFHAIVAQVLGLPTE